MEKIRKIERTIDSAHKSHAIFNYSMGQAIFNTVRIFEDMCRLGVIGGIGEKGEYNRGLKHARTYLDALTIAIKWIYDNYDKHECDDFDFIFSDEDALIAFDFLINYAKPYFGICCGFIGYSRGFFQANIDETESIVTFTTSEKQMKICVADLAERIRKDSCVSLADGAIDSTLRYQIEDDIFFKEERLCYNIDSNVWGEVKRLAVLQWDASKTFPDNWQFDLFSMKEFRRVWIQITALCYYHSSACIFSGVKGGSVEDCVIVQKREDLIQFIVNKTYIDKKIVTDILDYLTYDNSIVNNDVIFQPLIQINKYLLITPYLFMMSRPDRNLISLIAKKNDSHYFEITNELEAIMQDELDLTINGTNILKRRNINLDIALPDVDFAIYFIDCNIMLLCELKWLNDADSPTELFAKIEEIEHGLDQLVRVEEYVKSNPKGYFKKIFSQANCNTTCNYCVVAKNNIQSLTDRYPVIGMRQLVNVISSNISVDAVNIINNRTYYEPCPIGLELKNEEIIYANHIISVPAMVLSKN